MPSHLKCVDCDKTFLYAAKKSIAATTDQTCTVETYVCPYCESLNLAEQEPEAPVQEQPTNVYVYELTTGAQTELDKLLAQGYQIVSRFSKQYHLEKPKTKEAAQ